MNKDFEWDYLNSKVYEIMGNNFIENAANSNAMLSSLYNPQTLKQLHFEETPMAKALKGEVINNEEIIVRNKQNPKGKSISISAYPLVNTSKNIDHIIVFFRDITPFFERQEELVEDKHVLEASLQQRTERLDLINTILNISVREHNLERYLAKIIKEVCFYLRYDSSHVLLQEDASFHFSQINYFYSIEDRLKFKSLKKTLLENLEEGLIKQSIDQQEALFINNLDHHAACAFKEDFIKLGVKSIISFPIILDKKNPYVFLFLSNFPKNFKRSFKNYLTDISQIIGNCVYSYHNEQNLLAKNKDLKKEIENKSKEITEKSKIVETLSKVKQEFIAKIGHELRTPLNAILGYSELANEDFKNKDYNELANYNNKIKASADHLLNMVTNLINIADISHTKVDKVLVDPLKFLSELEAYFKYSIKENHNTLTITCGADTGELFTDYEKLKVILTNILKNACKFTKNGSIILNLQFNYSNQVPVALFKISDNGEGIDEDHLNGLFQLFSQEDNSYTRPYEGLGVGLYIAKLYADMLGASIQVTSEKHKGSSFTVTLPVR